MIPAPMMTTSNVWVREDAVIGLKPESRIGRVVYAGTVSGLPIKLDLGDKADDFGVVEQEKDSNFWKQTEFNAVIDAIFNQNMFLLLQLPSSVQLAT